jgi:hypothetical protein
MIDLQAIFDDGPTMAPAIMPEPEAMVGADAAGDDLPLFPIPRPDPADAVVWEDAIDPPLPCPKCGSLELWESMAGSWRCMICDPPVAALRLLEHVEKLRARKQPSSIAPVASRRPRSIYQSSR